jgi:Ca2+-binding EF-hand superfamily protein
MSGTPKAGSSTKGAPSPSNKGGPANNSAKPREEVDGIIKTPSTKKGSASESVSATAKAGKRALPDDQKAKESSNKTSKKGKGKETKADKEKTKRAGRVKKKPKKTCISQFLAQFGIGQGFIRLTDPYAIETAQAIDLKQSHLQTLMRAFETIDVDGSGNIDVDEFLEHLGEGRSPFTDRLFQLVDVDGSGSLEFDEFVRILAT